MDLNKRYDFVFFFDVKDGNPNGDPDAGNLPRVDAETGNGLVTDVCLKRKVRNYVTQLKLLQRPYDIYVKEKAVLGRAQYEAFRDLGIEFGAETRVAVPEDIQGLLKDAVLPEGLTFEEDENVELVVAADVDLKEVKSGIKDLPKELKVYISSSLKGVKARKPKAEEVEKGRVWMCQNFYDIRAFGAVMSLKSAPNCGQVRGPIQLTFSRSVDPIVASEHSITRMAVATEAEAKKQGGDNRTMGRKFTVPYGLYRTHGFVSAPLAKQTGFSQEDLELFWEALQNMFENDRSAARGLMSARRLVIFEHSSLMGNASAQDLFDRVKAERASDPAKAARDFTDYKVTLDGKELAQFKTVVPA